MPSKRYLSNRLSRYFTSRTDVVMAFLFGSYAKGHATRESDLDIAVYFYPKTNRLEWEEDTHYLNEGAIWSEIEELTGLESELLVLNRASATVAASVLQEGIPLVVKDIPLYWRFFLTISSEAEDFRQLIEDFRQIKQRSRSLTEIDRSRLITISDFLEPELSDYPGFRDLTREQYLNDSAARRNVERWIENIVNSSIDIAKILIASSQKRMPQTYRGILENLALMKNFDKVDAQGLSDFARLRNILAHEYLDVRYKNITAFIAEAEPLYKRLVEFTKQYLPLS